MLRERHRLTFELGILLDNKFWRIIIYTDFLKKDPVSILVESGKKKKKMSGNTILSINMIVFGILECSKP